MLYIPLLRQPLKGQVIVDLLEAWDADVTYDFDRLAEGAADRYSAASKVEGTQLIFDADQLLKTVFLHVTDDAGYCPADLSESDVPQLGSPAAVAESAQRQSISVSSGRAELLGVERTWARLEWPTHTLHYEFVGGTLRLITLAAI